MLLLSSSHAGNRILPEHANKREIIADYNHGKKGVDQFDQNIEEFTCRRKTVRWPLLFFYNMIDIACFNAFLLMKKNGYKKSRKEFLRNMAYQLVGPGATRRHELNKIANRD